MATVSATEPRAGTVHRVIDTVLSARVWEGDRVLDLFEQLVERFKGHGLEEVPAALGEALMTLRLSPPHLDLALDTIAEFDLYEAAPGLGRLLREAPSSAVIAATSGFARHPGAVAGLQDQLLTSIADHEPREEHVRQLVRLSLAPDTAAPARPYELARIRRWPGTVSMSAAVAPIIALAGSAGPKSDELVFALDLYKAGAIVRRLPEAQPDETFDKRWLARWIPVVAATDSEQVWWSEYVGRVVPTGGRLTPAVRRETLHELNRRLPSHLKLRLEPSPGRATSLTSPLEDVDVFFSGAFQTHEVAFLGGLSVGTLLKHAKGPHDELHPVQRRQTPPYYWPFPVLVGLRVWTYLRGQIGRKFSISLAAEFVRRAEGERAVPVAVTRNGDVLFHVEDDIYETPAGQFTSEVLLLREDVLERFDIGKRHAPRLEEPSTHTSVHPEIQGGSPVVRGTRLPAEAVQALVRVCDEAGMTRQAAYRSVQQRYPELDDPIVIEDAIALAHEMQAVK